MRHKLAAWFMIAFGLLTFACGGKDMDITPAPESSPGGSIISLGDLPVPAADARRRVATASYELLLIPPVALSPDGSANHTPGELILDPAKNGGMAWAVYALPSVPADDSVYPTDFIVSKDLPSNIIWAGCSNYDRGRWDFSRIVFSGVIPLENGQALNSPEEVVYVALVATTNACTVDSVTVHANADLPGGPIAVIDLPDVVYAGHPASFSALGSDPGEGEWDTLTYTFDGGNEQVTSLPETVVEHTFGTAGPHTVELTVMNDQQRSAYTEETVQVEDLVLVQELLIIYNSDMPKDLDLVEYYSSYETGRGIDPAYRLGLQLGAEATETISRSESTINYGASIRDPIIAFLDANPDIKANIKYLLMMKGVPYRIPGPNGGVHDWSENSSVDSELCLLYSGGVVTGENYRLPGAVWNESQYHAWNGDGFYLAGDVDFVPSTFTTTDLDGAHWPLDYLVGRLTAYTYDTAKAMVDRSVAADTTGTGWVIFDTKAGSQPLETMFDPVWPVSHNDWDSGVELLTWAGFNVFGEETNDVVTYDYEPLPEGAEHAILGYCSWGKHSAFDQYYILDDLGFDYVPGACFMSYESFNGNTFRCSDPDNPSEGHPGQGQLADFFHMGGTVGICNVYEPWTDGCGDERWVFDRYIHHGDRWIEAAYKGLPMLSWQEIVVGDPLCRVVAE